MLVFLEALAERVESQTAYMGSERLYFRDESATLSDGRWEPPLLEALRSGCSVLVALCTPRYFARRPEGKCYCGREVSLFRRRGVDNIVPVLWEIVDDDPRATVPTSLHGIDWSIGRDLPTAVTLSSKARAMYTTVGLRDMWPMFPRARDAITLDLARRVIRMAKAPPPALTVPVDMADEDCAFHPGEAAQRALSGITGEPSAEMADPRGLMLVYVAECQLPTESQDLLEHAGRDLNYVVAVRVWSIGEGAEALRLAAEKNRAVVLVADGLSPLPADVREALQQVITHGGWIGGVLQFGGDLGLASAPGVTVRAAQATYEDVRRQLVDLVNGARRTLQRFAVPVTPPPPGRPMSRL